MTDGRLRSRERRFLETASLQDEAAWLLERVRVGVLAQERLKLAASLGHRGSQLATAQRVFPDAVEELRRIEAAHEPVASAVAAQDFEAAARLRDQADSLRGLVWESGSPIPAWNGQSLRLKTWFVSLLRAHQEVALRLGVALANAWRRRQAGESSVLAAVLDAAEQHLVSGSGADLDALADVVGEPQPSKVFHPASSLSSWLLRLWADGWVEDATDRDLVDWLEPLAASEAQLVAEVSDEVTSWALGERDHVAERVAAREDDS